MPRPEKTSEDTLSFEKAVSLFKEWGFRVEPGPEPEEVTLWLDAAGHRTCCVHPARLLPEIAAAIQQARARKERRSLRPVLIEGFDPNRRGRKSRLRRFTPPRPLLLESLN